jgi:hypothetical protein
MPMNQYLLDGFVDELDLIKQAVSQEWVERTVREAAEKAKPERVKAFGKKMYESMHRNLGKQTKAYNAKDKPAFYRASKRSDLASQAHESVDFAK